MRSFLEQEFVRLLQALDEELESPQRLIMIGGAAIAVGYHVAIPTRDIDAMNGTKTLERAHKRAVVRTGLNIPLGTAGVADAPYNYEDRLRPLKRPVLKKLIVLVPEKHDLVLMKTIRGDRRDLDAILALHRKVGLSRRTLERRFKSEMDHVVGDPRRVKLNFDLMLDFVFGAVA